MSRTLNLIDILLAQSRHLALMGRFTEALEPLAKLSGFRSLPEYALEELHSLFADIHLQQNRYEEARRHLAAALVLKPLKADHHYLMAIAIEEDSHADWKRAEMYFAKAVELEPDNAAFRVDFGSYLFKMGKAKEGLAAIRKAFALATTDADIVGEVAAILRREGHSDEATTKLRSALFHNHGTQQFQLLWQHHQFQLVHAAQQRKGETQSDRPVFLPFTAGRGHGKYADLGQRTIRIDQAETLKAPRQQTPQPSRRPPKKG
jgi:tetratricopeptide (TPR) repeat protein